MRKVKVKVMDYYNHPEYYCYMPKLIFDLLTRAFLMDREEVELPAEEFQYMLNSFHCNNVGGNQECSSHYYILTNYLTSEN